jgi:nicotinamide mononucleotide (NMN) deamidase PncC
MPVEVKVNTKGLDALSSSLSPAMVDKMVRAAGFEAEGNAKRTHKYQDRTGNLTNSGGTQKKGIGEVWVGNYAEYAPYVEKWDAFLEPAIAKAVDNLRRALEAIFKRAQR